MRRSLVPEPLRLVRLLTVVVLLGVLSAGTLLRPDVSTAQDQPAAPLVDVALDPMPPAPSFVRLIRITMAPGSSIPTRSHPGPKIDRIASGTLTANVRDEGNTASVAIDGAEQTGVTGGEDVSLGAGDVIVLPPETFYTFRNEGSEPVVLLSTIMLPAGHQRPPGITYADGEPPSGAYDGVTNQILGDGVATIMPTAPGRFVIDRVTVTPDQPLPASSDVTLLSNTAKSVDITVNSGRVQVSRTVAPGPQRDSAVDSAYTLISGDGIFFPAGHDEITVPDGELTFTRMTLTGGPAVDSGASTSSEGTPAAAGTSAASDSGAISVVSVTTATPVPATSGQPQAEATETPASEPTQVATEAPIDETAPTAEVPVDESGGTSGFSIGSTVATVDTGVNVRAEPAAEAEVVLAVEVAGTQFVVIGEAVSADGFDWVPVQSIDDPSISGWIAVDFLAAV